jgi:hypothetical protein
LVLLITLLYYYHNIDGTTILISDQHMGVK